MCLFVCFILNGKNLIFVWNVGDREKMVYMRIERRNRFFNIVWEGVEMVYMRIEGRNGFFNIVGEKIEVGVV